MKGAIQIDFAVAVGFFLVLFAFLVQYATQYYTTVKDTAEMTVLRSEALSLLGAAKREPVPANWSGAPLRIGLKSYAFRFFIPVNNTQAFWLNQSMPVSQLENELVVINMSGVFSEQMDIHSLAIDDNGTLLPYHVDGTNITFAVSVPANGTTWITVSFDDDSNFTPRSQSVSGSNNITERILAVERFPIVQFRLLQQLGASNYDTVRAQADIEHQFRMQLFDPSNATFFSYGISPPNGNVVSLDQFVVYQNATAAVLRGRLRVQVW